MLTIRTSLFTDLLLKFTLALTLLTPSGAFELFKEGGAIPQAELLDVKAQGFWAYVNILFWPLALLLPLCLLAVRGNTNYLKQWRSGPGIRIATTIIALSVLQLLAGTPLFDGSIRVTVSILLTTLVLLTTVNQLSTDDLLRSLNRLYFFCFAFSLYLIFLVPSYGISADHDSAWQGMFFHKNALGTFCASYAALSLITWRAGRLLTLINLALSALLIFRSQSYTAIAAYALSILLMLPPRQIKRAMLAARRTIVGVSFGVSLAIVALSVSSFKFKILDKDFTFSDRNLIWGYSLLRFIHAPVLGQGINSLGHEVAAGDTGLYHATGQMLTSHHNGFIAALYDFGLLGVAAFFLIFSGALRRIRGNGSIQYAYLCFFLAAILMNTFEERLISFNLFLFIFLLFSYLNEKDLSQSFPGSQSVYARESGNGGCDVVEDA